MPNHGRVIFPSSVLKRRQRADVEINGRSTANVGLQSQDIGRDIALLNRIRAGILWSRAIGERRAGRGAATRNLIERMERLISLKPYHVVMLAHAEVLDGNHDQASIHLKTALKMMASKESANARYLKLHAEALSSLVEGGDYDSLAREAAEIACTPRLRRWFPTLGRSKACNGDGRLSKLSL